MFFVLYVMSIASDFDRAYQDWFARSSQSCMTDIQGFIACLEYQSETGSTDPMIDLFLDYVEQQISSDPTWVKTYAS